MQVIPLGIDLTDCAPAPEWPDPPVIGFLSRLSPALGLGVLVEAFLRLKQSPRWQHLKLRATGGQTGDDAAFISQLRRKLAAAGCAESAEFLPAFDRSKRLEFLRSLSVLSVPVPTGEAFGSYLLEANAVGVPVVQPNLSAFPEIVHATGGGILYDPSRLEALAEALASLLGNPNHARKLGEQGRRRVQERFGIGQMARDVVRVYESL
jgi:glycosyltransferase involved in cell wall biosynthesis